MTEYELLLFDRLEVIRKTIEKYGEDKFYISLSGGKDSTVLHHLIDEAIPGNKIPRVFINTGIEYIDIVRFVKDMQRRDDRIRIITVGKNIPQTLEKVGYPFKSKEHSLYVSVYQSIGKESKTVKKYLSKEDRYSCPKSLRYQFEDEFDIKISNKCCFEFKKNPIHEYEKETGRVAILGIRSGEGGLRSINKGCVLIKDGKIKKFKPMNTLSDDFIDWYIKERDIKLCVLYYDPYNFKRTGCKGCPYNVNLQKDLDTMKNLLPIEYKQCEYIWKPIYDEYRRIGYRLDIQERLF